MSPDKYRIAVLSLANISPDLTDEYFTDGMTEELILTLAKITKLRVIARTSVMKYKKQPRTIAEIGHELGVQSILEGSVRKSGNVLRITVQLIDAKSEEHIWSQQYDRELKDVFAIQSDIAKRVASALKIQILREEKRKIEKPATSDLDAYSEYLNGRFHWNQRTETGLQEAIKHFTNALTKDQAYALAYSGIADSYAMMALFEFLPPSFTFPKAKAAAEKALELDSKLAEAHTSLGLVHFQYDRDWAAAEKEFKESIKLNPNYPAAHQFYADYLKAMGRFPEALAEMKLALELDPLSLAINTGLGHVLYLSRQYDEAIVQYRKSVEMDPNYLQAHLWFGRPYLQKGMYAEAIAEVRQAVQLSEASTMALSVLGHIYASAGKKPEAEEILAKLKVRATSQYVPSYWIALIYVGLGDTNEAFKWLEKAYTERSSWLAWVNVEPRFDGIRSDPRFLSLLKKMRFQTELGPSDGRPEKLLSSFLNRTTTIKLSGFRVVGNYTRYEEATRNTLKDLKQKIVSSLNSSSPKHENYLIWAPPGSGKTFLVQQIASSVKTEADYYELNLAELEESKFRTTLSDMALASKPVICLIDEVDSKANQTWPYEALLVHLDTHGRQPGRKAFILAGSSGSNLGELKRNIGSRPKGTDMLSRIPHENEYVVPPLTPEDRILVALTTLHLAGKELSRDISEVERLALYYIGIDPRLSSARQLREFAYRCIERIPASEDRIKYDNLFSPGDTENKEFWITAKSLAPGLINTFIHFE